MHTLDCEVCGREFQATRSDARSCSGRCRVQRHRLLRAGKSLPGDEALTPPTRDQVEQFSRIAAWLETAPTGR